MSKERIDRLVNEFPVQVVCEVLGISRSAVHKRQRDRKAGQRSFRARQDARLEKEIDEILEITDACTAGQG